MTADMIIGEILMKQNMNKAAFMSLGPMNNPMMMPPQQRKSGSDFPRNGPNGFQRFPPSFNISPALRSLLAGVHTHPMNFSPQGPNNFNRFQPNFTPPAYHPNEPGSDQIPSRLMFNRMGSIPLGLQGGSGFGDQQGPPQIYPMGWNPMNQQ